MQSIDTRAIEAFDRTLADILENAPDERRELHEKLADLLEDEVKSGIPEITGKVRRWQVRRVGSRGGYAAISAKKGKLTANSKGKSYSYGQITNALESGHKIRPPSGDSKWRYRKDRIHVGYVNGLHFYQSAGTNIEAKAIQMAEQFADQLAAKLEGGLL